MVLNGDPKGKNMLYCNGKTVVIRDIEVSELNILVEVQVLSMGFIPFPYH